MHYDGKTPKLIVSKELIIDGVVRQLIIIILYNLHWKMLKHGLLNVHKWGGGGLTVIRQKKKFAF